MLKFPGTAVYMPPESVADAEISGCVVLEMITGKLPWECMNLTDLAIKLLSLRNLPKIPENLSSAGKDFLMKCFARDPSERWTADMLLSHPFLLPDCTWLPYLINSLPSAQADRMMLLV
ncbi:Protein kinase domain - like 10 [Theobroma cacao]|nr:Protein kinase domain - like 10 [Theobroma cacao]